MADHPFDTAAEVVDANMTPGGVSETLLDAMKKRTSLALGATETLGDCDFSEGSPPNAVVYGATGYVYFYNADDTTSPDDGLTVLVSADGRRYILADASAIAISSVLAIDDDPPASPTDGDAYVVGTSPIGAWVAHAKDIALATPRGWVFAQPQIGTALLNQETEENIQYDASGTWVAMPTAVGVDSLTPEQTQFWGGLSVEAQQNDPPGSPVEGEYYLVGLIPTGDWVGHENEIAYWTSTSVWAFLEPYDLAAIGNKAADTTLQWFDSTGDWRAPWPYQATCQGRLTLESGVPISATDQTAKGTLYFTPYMGNSISLYVNGGWALRTFTEKSLSLAGYTAGKPYDIFGYDNGGVLALESLVWTNDSTRATAIALQDGIWVKSGDPSRRLLGTLYTSATGQSEDSLAKRLVGNVHTPVQRPMRKQAADASWSYSSSTIRQANGNVANQIEFVSPVPGDMTEAEIMVFASGANQHSVFVGLDSTTAAVAGQTRGGFWGESSVLHARWRGYAGVGRHRLTWLESEASGNGVTFQTNSTANVSAITGTMRG